MKVINGVSIFSSRVVKNVRGGNKAKFFSSDHTVEFDTIDKFVASVEESEEEEEEDEEDHRNPRFSDTRKSGVLRTRGGGLASSNGGVKPKQKKSVTFADNGNAYRASMGNVNEEETFDTEKELIKNLSKRVEKLGMATKGCEGDEEEDGGSSGSSDNEMNLNYISRKDGYYERNLRDENDNEHENERSVFSAPMPVKMEDRAADYINRKKGVKIVEHE